MIIADGRVADVKSTAQTFSFDTGLIEILEKKLALFSFSSLAKK